MIRWLRTGAEMFPAAKSTGANTADAGPGRVTLSDTEVIFFLTITSSLTIHRTTSNEMSSLRRKIENEKGELIRWQPRSCKEETREEEEITGFRF